MRPFGSGKRGLLLSLQSSYQEAVQTKAYLRAFEEFVFEVCFLNDPDPIARWQELEARQQRFCDWFQGHERMHILRNVGDFARLSALLARC